MSKLISLENREIKKIHNLTKVDRFKKKPDKIPKHWIEVNYKGYPRFEKIKLPKPNPLRDKDLHSVFVARQSIRVFSRGSIDLKELSTLLYYSVGLKDKRGEDVGNRFYPSAGARYPVETYLIALNVKSLRKGLYHYHVKTHSLEFMWRLNSYSEISCCFNQDFIKDSAIIIILTGIFWRTEVKYGIRGYRYVIIETGHICQNFYLIGTALNLGVCSIGGFIDSKIEKILDIDKGDEDVIIILVVGKKERG